MKHVTDKTGRERFIVSRVYREKKYFFLHGKKVPADN